MPPKKLSGTDITSAHGQDTIRNVRALYSQVAKLPPKNTGGMTASSTAAPTTIGVYTLAKRVMKDSLFDLWSAACSTSSSMRLAVDSPNSFSTFTRTAPLKLMHPEAMGSPSETPLGTLSPVRAFVSSEDLPSMTVPSKGTLSPDFTTMTSPTCTSSGRTVLSPSPVSRFALSGLMSIKADMLLRLRPSAMPSKSSPSWKKSITKTASGNWLCAPGRKPMARAPRVATPIRKSSSRASPSSSFSAPSQRVSQPTIR